MLFVVLALMSLLRLTRVPQPQHPLTTVVLSVKLAEGVAELLAAAKKQQGQYTEAVDTTHCIIHWAHASVLHGSCIG